MKQVVEENKERKNEKIVEIFNEKIEAEGYPSQKIDTKNLKEMEKASNLLNQRKYYDKTNNKITPAIYTIENLEHVLAPYRVVPPPEDLNTPFILSSRIGNGQSEDPIYLVVSTRGLLMNAHMQA